MTHTSDKSLRAVAELQQVLVPGNVIFLHGLESGPLGNKGRWLNEHLLAFSVDLDTSDAVALYRSRQAQGLDYSLDKRALEEAFQTPMANARRALNEYPVRVIVGSSFGGAVLLKLIQEEAWSGPSVFIAQAGVKLTTYRSIPEHVPAVLIHGTGDAVVPIQDSRLLAEHSGAQTQLWEIDDGHRMHTILESGLLADAILSSLKMAEPTPHPHPLE